VIRARYLVGLVSALAGVAVAWSPVASATQNQTSSLADVSWAVAHQNRAAAACFGNVTITSLGNGRLVSAELGYTGANNGMLRARATAVGPWEVYTVCFNGSATTIQSQANGRFVSAELGYSGANNGMLRARATVVGPWEKFSIDSCGGNCVTIHSTANNRFTSAELGYSGANNGMLRARATVVGPWERFQ
jgi:hypothetical protein